MSTHWVVSSVQEHPLLPWLNQVFQRIETIQLTSEINAQASLDKLTHHSYQSGDPVIYLNTPWHYAAPETLEEHLNRSLSLFHACLKHDARLLYLSTHAVYGEPLYTPIDENHPLQGFSPYASSRTATDLLAQSYAESFGLNVTVVRLFPIFGPGYYSQFIDSLHAHRLSLDLDDYTFSLLHVVDAAHALEKITVHKELQGKALNLGGAHQISLADLLNKTLPTGELEPLTLEKTYDIAHFLNHRYPDLDKLNGHLDWQAEQTEKHF